MQRNHAPHRVVCEALVDEITKNCNLTQLIQVFYDNEFRDLAQELFLCYQESRMEVTIHRINRAETSNRREIIKQRISNTDDPVEKMNKCDKFVALTAAEIDALTNTSAIQSQRRIGVERMEMDMVELNAVKKFSAKFVDNIYPIPMADVLRKNCIIDEPFYREILQMQRNHAPRRVLCEALVNETTKNCNLNQLIEVLYYNGFRDLAKELFLCYQESRNIVALLRVNRADTNNRRKIGEYFKHIKQQVHAMAFKNSLSAVYNLGEEIKKSILNIDDPVQKMYACDKFIALKAAEMDSLTNIAGIVSKDHPGYLEMKRYVSSTSNPALAEVILYGRQSDVLSTIGDFEEAEDLMRQALVSANTSCSCVEVTDMFYKNVVVKLSKFEKNPHDEELRKSIVFEADRGLWTLHDESDDLRLFWTKLFLLRMAFAHLGIGKFCDIVQNYVPNMQSIVEAERILQLDTLKDLEHRRQMFIAVARARLEEWKGNMEGAMKYLQIARKLAKEGKYAEDRALADYEILLKRDPWQTYVYTRHRHEHGIEEQNSLVLNLKSSISPSSLDDSTDQKTYFFQRNDSQCHSSRIMHLEISRTVSDTQLNRSLEHLDPQSPLLSSIDSLFSNTSTGDNIEHLDLLSLQGNASEPALGNNGARHDRFDISVQTSNAVSDQIEASSDSHDDSYPSLEHLHSSSFER
ncbi:unnamed protein product [Mytilus coruscus]|uniref:Uncharacterized protein n=1 Tax=Mytilus coruscus TaxID=42192 RepID=A0A6J8CW55_MYTCO|nr:unnamed protein product [Mytilus coruscus]